MRIDMQALKTISVGEPTKKIAMKKSWLITVAETLEASSNYDTSAMRLLARTGTSDKVTVERIWLANLHKTLLGLEKASPRQHLPLNPFHSVKRDPFDKFPQLDIDKVFLQMDDIFKKIFR